MKISKLKQFEDKDLDRQIQEIVDHQEASKKRIAVEFTAASTTTYVDVGFFANRYRVIRADVDIRVWDVDRDTYDNQYLHLQASGAGNVILEVWEEE